MSQTSDALRELGYAALADNVDELESRCVRAEEALRRALYIADHLFSMVPQSVWRDSGADDMQGHYEGDYHAEQTRVELDELAAVVPEENKPPEGYIIPEGDEQCDFTMDACICMKRKGHDGLHACAHGGWR